MSDYDETTEHDETRESKRPSALLLIAGLAANAGVTMAMFSFAPVAVPVALLGWVVLVVTAPLMLRGRTPSDDRELSWRAEIPIGPHANAIGRSAAALGVARTREFELIAVERWGAPAPLDTPLAEHDVVVYRATEAGVRALWASPRFGLSPHDLYLVTICADDQDTIRGLEDDEDLTVVAAETDEPLRDTIARPGRVALVTARSVDVVADHPLVGLWQKAAGKAPQTRMTWVALAILLMVIVAGTFGLAPIELAAVTGAALMVVTGVLTPRSAVRALNWEILAIIAGSVGLGVIVVKSGLGEYISHAILTLSGGNTALVAVVICVGTTVLTNLVTNAAAAAILTPVALEIAAATGLDPVLLLAMIGTCISFTFLNPYSHQTNLMVMKPGGYSTAVFVRYGVYVYMSVSSTSGIGAYSRPKSISERRSRGALRANLRPPSMYCQRTNGIRLPYAKCGLYMAWT